MTEYNSPFNTVVVFYLTTSSKSLKSGEGCHGMRRYWDIFKENFRKISSVACILHGSLGQKILMNGRVSKWEKRYCLKEKNL